MKNVCIIGRVCGIPNTNGNKITKLTLATKNGCISGNDRYNVVYVPLIIFGLSTKQTNQLTQGKPKQAILLYE